MKRPFLYLCLVIIFFSGALASCSKSKPADNVSHYTCSMHPQVTSDKPGECPICGMDLVPVHKEASPAKQNHGVVISSERQQLIGLKTAILEKKAVRKELRTIGKVAFDPELAIAEREYVEISQAAPELKEAAHDRLRLLGLGDEEIRALHKKSVSGNLYLPGKNDSLWIYATLYEHEMSLVKVGDNAIIQSTTSKDPLEGTVRAIDPVINATTRSVRARIEIPKAGEKLKPEAVVTVLFSSQLGEQLVIPASAVIDTGTRQIVFMIHDGQHFMAHDVKLGEKTDDGVIVLEGLKAGDAVAASSAFLIDSESQLKAAVENMEHVH
ncbi:MAG: efflux RND transporter periplasmic adaptor subunit [Deltaproteobacteria bacterium]|nr:efflux RND transporter periplasmic adaptor subunit [Deltaproteobacteria bacterium]